MITNKKANKLIVNWYKQEPFKTIKSVNDQIELNSRIGVSSFGIHIDPTKVDKIIQSLTKRGFNAYIDDDNLLYIEY